MVVRKTKSIFAVVTQILWGQTTRPPREFILPKEHRTPEVGRILTALVEKLYRDTDTGLPNYQAFTHELLDVVLARKEAKEKGEEPVPHTVLFLDINYFKGFNSEFGMQRTDKLVKAIAGVIQDEIRVHNTKASEEHRHLPKALPDMLARAKKGGDEFLILLRGCEANRAKQIAENICTKVNSKIFMMPDLPARPHSRSLISNISLAYGYYELNSNLRKQDGEGDKGEPYDTPHSAIDKAERLMHKRKNQRKSRNEYTEPKIDTGLASMMDKKIKMLDENYMVHIEPLESLRQVS